MASKKFLILGSGGHGRVVLEALQLLGAEVHGWVDSHTANAVVMGLPVVGTDEEAIEWNPEDYYLANGLGSTQADARRKELYENYTERGFQFPAILHPNSIVSKSAKVAKGCQVMAGAILQTGVVLHQNTIVNTGAQLDHDCEIARHCHIAPGAVLSGGVSVGECTLIGTGSRVIQNIKIGEGALVGAGSVVIDEIPANSRVAGNPAQSIE